MWFFYLGSGSDAVMEWHSSSCVFGENQTHKTKNRSDPVFTSFFESLSSEQTVTARFFASLLFFFLPLATMQPNKSSAPFCCWQVSSNTGVTRHILVRHEYIKQSACCMNYLMAPIKIFTRINVSRGAESAGAICPSAALQMCDVMF